MKRAVLTLGAISLLLILAAAYFLQPDTSIDHTSFQPRFSAACRSANFYATEQSMRSADDVPFPWSLRPQRRSPTRDSGIQFAIGSPDAAEHYKLATGDSPPVDCFVRYFDGRAAFIAIHARPSEAATARTLRSALSREFPGFTITLTTASHR